MLNDQSSSVVFGEQKAQKLHRERSIPGFHAPEFIIPWKKRALQLQVKNELSETIPAESFRLFN